MEIVAALVGPIIVAGLGGGLLGDWLRARRTRHQDTMDLFLPAWKEDMDRARAEVTYLRKVVDAYGVELSKMGVDVLAVRARIAEASLAEDLPQGVAHDTTTNE